MVSTWIAMHVVADLESGDIPQKPIHPGAILQAQMACLEAVTMGPWTAFEIEM